MKFYYLDKVKIIKEGFYKGATGIVIEHNTAWQMHCGDKPIGPKYPEVFKVQIDSRGTKFKNIEEYFETKELENIKEKN